MTQPHKEIVGILIPTFNRRRFLEQAVKSALEQTYSDIAIIVVNDCSTDSTADFIEGIQDPRLKHVINEHNLGLINSINKGITLFNDEVKWCTILCDDDVLDRDFMSILMNTARDLKVKSIIHSHRIFINPQGHTIREAEFFPQEATALDYLKMRYYFNKETYITGLLFNRRAFIEIGGYPAFSTGVAADDAFIFALALKDRLVFECSATALIRIHEEAESRSPHNAIIKMKTIDQFSEYCMRIAKESSAFNSSEFNEFQTTLNAYCKRLRTHWWLEAAHSFTPARDREHEQVAKLVSFTDIVRGRYTLRVILAVRFHKLTDIFLEQYKVYQACWRFYIKFYSSILKLFRAIWGNLPMSR